MGRKKGKNEERGRQNSHCTLSLPRLRRVIKDTPLNIVCGWKSLGNIMVR